MICRLKSIKKTKILGSTYDHLMMYLRSTFQYNRIEKQQSGYDEQNHRNSNYINANNIHIY